MIPLHIPGEVPPPPGVRLAVAMVAGVVATLGMTVVMRLQSHGYIPAYVAAAALWRRPPEAVRRSAADAVHLAAGMAAAVAFESLVVGYERLREPLGIGVEVIVANVTTLSELLALLAVVGFLYGFFSWLVFPRYGGAAYAAKAEIVRRQWAVSAVSYGVFLLVSLKAIYTVVSV